MKENIKQTKGITLIALVITIIILLILATVTIRAIQGDKIIKHAEDAASKYSKAQENEQEELLKAEYEMEKAQGTTTGTLTDYILDKKYPGVKIGDKVNYDEGTGYSTTVKSSKSGYTDDQTFKTDDLNWRVLGINTKGELELISDNPTSDLYLQGETGYLNAEEVLNNMCNELYGKGTYATGARSLNAEDINKLGNYDPTTYSKYGDIYTYRFPTSGDYMQYKRTKADGTLVTDWKNITSSSYQKFRMPGETETISADNRNDTGKSLEYTYYNYTVADKVKQTTSDGKKMSDIISNGTGSSTINQWLASRCVDCNVRGGAYFYVCTVFGSNFMLDSMACNSTGKSSAIKQNHVRPVISLSSGIKLTETNTGSGEWNIEQ